MSNLSFLVLAVLLTIATANPKVVIGCAVCADQSGPCLTYTGPNGLFKEQKLPGLYMWACSYWSPYPITYEFSCTSNCTSGCSVAYSESRYGPINYCSDSSTGQQMITYMDNAYRVATGDIRLIATYDWCSCSATPPTRRLTSDEGHLNRFLSIIQDKAQG
jgi:hypothetical protein